MMTTLPLWRIAERLQQQVDPILQKLLPLVQAYKTQLHQVDVDDNHPVLMATIHTLQQLIVQLQECFHRLQEEKEVAPAQTNNNRTDDRDVRGFLLLQKYITLPLTTVLHLFPSPSSEHPFATVTSHAAFKSRLHQLQTIAAQTLQKWLEYVMVIHNTLPHGTHSSVSNTTNLATTTTIIQNNDEPLLLPKSVVEEYGYALAQAFSHIPKPRQQQQQQKTQTTSSSATTTTVPSASLDNGEDLLLVLFDVLQTLFQATTTNNTCWLPRYLSQEKEEAARLDDDQEQPQKQKQQATLTMIVTVLVDRMVIWMAPTKNGETRTRYRIRLAAMQSLVSLLQCTRTTTVTTAQQPLPEDDGAVSMTMSTFWQSLFPGIWMALLQIENNTHQQKRQPADVHWQSSIQLVQITRLLLEATLSSFVITDDEHTQKEGHHGTTATTASDMLLALSSLSLRQHQQQSSTTTKATITIETQTVGTQQHQAFLQNVRKSAILPLQRRLEAIQFHLLSSGESQQHASLWSPMSPSKKTYHAEVTELCNYLLVQTPSCWDGTNVLETAIETCLMLLETTTPTTNHSTRFNNNALHSGEIQTERVKTILQKAASSRRRRPLHIPVSRDPKQIVSQRKDAHDETTNGASRSRNSWIVTRISGLIEELYALAVARTHTQKVQQRLTLITAYIEHVLTPKLAYELTAANSASAIRSLCQLMKARRRTESEVTHVVGDLVVVDLLDLESRKMAEKMLRSLGNVIDSRKTALLIDDLVCDYLEGTTTTKRPTQFSTADSELLLRWSGNLVVSKELLVGAHDGMVRKFEKSSTKGSPRDKRVFQALVMSLAPHLVEVHRRGSLTSMRDTRRLSSAAQMMTVLQLELLASFATLLGPQTTSLLPVILFPLAEKSSSQYPACIQDMANRCLVAVAQMTGVDRIEQLVLDNLALLMGTTFGKLRLPGGSSTVILSDLSISVDTVCTLQWILDTILASEATISIENACLPTLIDIVALLMDRFDQFFLNKVLSEDNIFTLCRIYDNVFHFLLRAYGGDRKETYSFEQEVDGVAETPWLNLLTALRKAEPEKAKQAPKEPTTGSDAPADLSIDSSTIQFVTKVLLRLNYFLSNESLLINVTSCDSISSGFQFLAFVSSHYGDSNDELATIQNSILRQIATSWPGLKARLHSVTDQLLCPPPKQALWILESTDVVANRHSKKAGNDDGPKRVFVAKLFTLISWMIRCGGGFISDRIKHDAWPIAARHLESEIRRFQRQTTSNQQTQSLSPKLFASEDSSKLLILCLLKCVETAFGNRGCGANLRSLIPLVGALLFPFLEQAGEVADKTTAALQCLIQVDSDALYRPLLELSGKGIPPHPLFEKSCKGETTTILLSLPTVTKPSGIQGNCMKLLAFTDSLPEQAFA